MGGFSAANALHGGWEKSLSDVSTPVNPVAPDRAGGWKRLFCEKCLSRRRQSAQASFTKGAEHPRNSSLGASFPISLFLICLFISLIVPCVKLSSVQDLVFYVCTAPMAFGTIILGRWQLFRFPGHSYNITQILFSSNVKVSVMQAVPVYFDTHEISSYAVWEPSQSRTQHRSLLPYKPAADSPLCWH